MLPLVARSGHGDYQPVLHGALEGGGKRVAARISQGDGAGGEIHHVHAVGDSVVEGLQDASLRGAAAEFGRSVDFVIPKERLRCDARESVAEVAGRHTRDYRRHCRPVAAHVTRRKIVGPRSGGAARGRIGVHVASGDNHLLVRKGAVGLRGRAQRVGIALGKSVRRDKGIVLKRGMGLVDTGIDDADLDSRAGVGRAADGRAAPCLLHIAKGQLIGQMEVAHGHDSGHARQRSERGRLFRCGAYEYGVQQVLNGAGNSNRLRLQPRAEIALHIAQMLAIGDGNGARLFDAAGEALYYRPVRQHQHPFVSDQWGGRRETGQRQTKEEYGTQSQHSFVDVRRSAPATEKVSHRAGADEFGEVLGSTHGERPIIAVGFCRLSVVHSADGAAWAPLGFSMDNFDANPRLAHQGGQFHGWRHREIARRRELR
ncbi:MAG: hypothetical protein WDO73_32820 [Ignavibacteriota bacterium]